MTKKAVILTHVVNDELGILPEVLSKGGFSISILQAQSEFFQQGLESDLLIVLGGPIGANEEALYPFLNIEKALLQERIKRGKPILGICLGAQILAKAMGSRVYSGRSAERGWALLHLTLQGENSCLKHLEEVFHWHQDLFDLPLGAERLASTPLCPNQAFRYGNHILGLQFHIEADQKKIDCMAKRVSSLKGAEEAAKKCLHDWLAGVLTCLSLNGSDLGDN